MPYKKFSKWQNTSWYKRGADYLELKEKITEKLLEITIKYNPQIKGHVVVKELSTPLSTKHFTSYKEGEIYEVTVQEVDEESKKIVLMIDLGVDGEKAKSIESELPEELKDDKIEIPQEVIDQISDNENKDKESSSTDSEEAGN